ncbi:MAG: hypothetical protein K9K37_07025 [Desulfocapsa sp.]|nr:hypothetical protein [Desulfocapsa sp.]
MGSGFHILTNEPAVVSFQYGKKSRIHVPGGVYHVMMRGNGGQGIFYSEQDRYRIYLLLQEGISRFKIGFMLFV